MNLIEEVLSAQGGNLVNQLVNQFGLSQSETKTAVSSLIPALAGGLKKTARENNDLSSLLAKVAGNKDMLESIKNPELLQNNASTDGGNAILGEIFGSKTVSRQVADQTSSATGIDSGILKKMLPMLATVMMSSLSNKAGGSMGALGGLLGQLTQTQQSGGGGMLGGLLGSVLGGKKSASSSQGGLGSLLDFDGDGNTNDDVMNLVGKMFGK